MDALEVLRGRRSVRVYDAQRPVAHGQIETIVDCGRLAATARNTQPWEFIVVTDPTVRAAIAALATNGPFIADAPVCIAVACQEGPYYLEDGCSATQNLLLAAHALGLGSCWVAGDKKPYAAAVADLVGVPGEYRLVSLVAVGHALSVPHPKKRALAEVLHWEKF
jgi:nitroreductase